ncbi:ABC transporter ATP-binding protein [Maritalea myrionectae]|uniref:ABC transporter ATP-binding protein n=1 Tax=Maritalea myrionectae TaxID=454601 RepID=UPI00040D21E2|nr:ATP-binding cassette domain-containing protein [Maritalea myrionectae]
MAELQLENISKNFGSIKVIHDVSLAVQQGEFVVFVGPSGSGKSTMLRLIAGLEDISSGTLKIDGQVANDLTPVQRGIAMVFQSYALYPHMNVYDNMAFGLRRHNMSKTEADAHIRDTARSLDIEQYLDRLPRQLSGGQRQRVAIGRAIVRQPKLFLFDEPLSNLDAALRVNTRLEIAKLHERMPDTTMIYVTHDQIEAMTLADRIVVMNHGNIEQVGTPMELYHNPVNQFVAEFIGSPKMNIIQDENAVEKTGIRPEHIELVADGQGQWRGKVEAIEELGAETLVFVRLPTEELVLVRVGDDQSVTRNDMVGLAPIEDKILRFNRDGGRC